MALIMLRYIVYILTFFFHFYFIRLIYSFAATSTCKIDAEDWYWKKYFTILLLLFGKVESYPWTGCGFSFSTLCHTIFNDLKYSPPVTQQNCKWYSKTHKLLSDCKQCLAWNSHGFIWFEASFPRFEVSWNWWIFPLSLLKIEERSECSCLWCRVCLSFCHDCVWWLQLSHRLNQQQFETQKNLHSTVNILLTLSFAMQQ